MKRLNRNSLILISLAAITLAVDVLNCQAQFLGPVQGARIPGFEAIAAGQKCPEWCWAASVQMVARSQGVDLPQEVSVSKIFGPSIPCRPSGNIQNILAALQGIYRRDDGALVAIQARAFFGNQGYAAPLIQSIQSGRPFIFLTQTHAMVAVGVHWADLVNPAGYPTGYVQILDIELIDPYFTFGAREYNTFPIRPDTAGQISGAIEIQSISLTAPQEEPDENSEDEPPSQAQQRGDASSRERAIQECMEERPAACIDVCMESFGRSEYACRTQFCQASDPVNVRSWQRLCERRVDRERED